MLSLHQNPFGDKAGSLVGFEFVAMLYTVAAILFCLWIIAWIGRHLFGGAIHILLLLAITSFVFALVRAA